MRIDQDALLALGERIAENAAHLDAAMHRLLVDIRQFDADGGHFAADFKSCAHWLSWRVGWDLGTARDRVRVARRLGELPKIDDALRRGELSYSKCRALVRVATAKTEEALLTCATCSTGAQLEKICRRYQRARTSSEKAREEEDDQLRRHVTSRELDNGMVKLELVLHPDEAELAYKTMMAVAKRVSAETLCLADGAMAIFTQAASGGSTSRTPVEVVVTVPAVALAAGNDDECGELPDGTPVAAETARYLACDAGVVLLQEDAEGNTLSVGRKTRSIPVSIKRALLRRDRTCRYPGCTNSVFVHGHHLEHWADGGLTRLGNLITLCSTHHRLVHDRGIRIELGDGTAPRFLNSRGREIPAIPPRPWLIHPGMPSIRAANANTDLSINAETNRPKWDGNPVQYDWCVRALVDHADRVGA
jgi:hypothetical protein